MREVRIYQAGSYEVGETIVLSPEATMHVAVVLRMKCGDPLTLFCGAHQEFHGLITSITKKKVEVSLLKKQEVNRESPAAIHLVQAISKSDKMEMVVQKCVELGVASIQPIMTEHCSVHFNAERMEKKQAQWQAIAIAACEQCKRTIIPTLHPIVSLNHYLSHKPPFPTFILLPNTLKKWRDYPFNEQAFSLLIGPEGGFSQAELDLFALHDFLPLSLGPRVLRTETAAIAALSVLQAIYGDL